MRIWVDADACPAVIKDILYRAAERLKIEMTLVANKALRTPPSRTSERCRCRTGSMWRTATSCASWRRATWW